MWLCGGVRGTGRFLAFLVERFSSNQAVSDDLSRQPQEKNSVNRLFFIPSKAPLFTPSAGRGGWYPIWGVWEFFIDPPRAGGGGATHRQKSLYRSLPNTPPLISLRTKAFPSEIGVKKGFKKSRCRPISWPLDCTFVRESPPPPPNPSRLPCAAVL